MWWTAIRGGGGVEMDISALRPGCFPDQRNRARQLNLSNWRWRWLERIGVLPTAAGYDTKRED